MPWLEQHPTSGRFKVCFRWGGQQFKKTVKTTDRGEALAVLKRVEENIDLAERGRLEVPPAADVASFFLSDGKLPHRPKVEPPPNPLTLGELRDAYLHAYGNGAIEANSLQTVKMHLGHAVKTLGADFAVQGLTLTANGCRRNGVRPPRRVAWDARAGQGRWDFPPGPSTGPRGTGRKTTLPWTPARPHRPPGVPIIRYSLTGQPLRVLTAVFWTPRPLRTPG
jgi:hypothetical protein